MHLLERYITDVESATRVISVFRAINPKLPFILVTSQAWDKICAELKMEGQPHIDGIHIVWSEHEKYSTTYPHEIKARVNRTLPTE